MLDLEFLKEGGGKIVRTGWKLEYREYFKELQYALSENIEENMLR